MIQMRMKSSKAAVVTCAGSLLLSLMLHTWTQKVERVDALHVLNLWKTSQLNIYLAVSAWWDINKGFYSFLEDNEAQIFSNHHEKPAMKQATADWLWSFSLPHKCLKCLLNTTCISIIVLTGSIRHLRGSRVKNPGYATAPDSDRICYSLYILCVLSTCLSTLKDTVLPSKHPLNLHSGHCTTNTKKVWASRNNFPTRGSNDLVCVLCKHQVQHQEEF